MPPFGLPTATGWICVESVQRRRWGVRTRTNKVSGAECFVRDEVRTEHRSSVVEQPGEESKGGGPQAPSFGRLRGGGVGGGGNRNPPPLTDSLVTF